ncbi:hypothetical protein LEP1GSC198_0201 [Leptospira kirschneri str. JB]|nr:hypothetical protein LEP1GSC198_0201 [Leptospira kirschneri str. JB]
MLGPIGLVVSSFVRKGSGLKHLHQNLSLNFRRFFLCSQRKRIEQVKRITKLLFDLFLPLFTKKETKKKYDSFL